MQVFPIGRYRFFQQIQINSILNKAISNSTTGCLQVFGTSQSWLLYLEDGKLVYACYANKMFDLLYRKLYSIHDKSPAFNSDVYRQIKTIFETAIDEQSSFNPDYLAICWLVNQKYITHQQAERLIQELAIDVINSLLKIKAGCYELITETFLDDMPKFCNLDINEIIEDCQENMQISYNAQSRIYRKREHEVLKRNVNDIYLNQISSHRGTRFIKPHDRKTYTIVCVDDSPTVVNIIKKFLDNDFFLVVGINDPLKALMHIVRLKPDLILLDVEMPNLDGYELCSLLRKHSSFAQTPIIMVTGHTSLLDRAKSKIVRSSGYLAKPFTQANLLKIIFKHLVQHEES
ncbi:response regulator [Calothrix sp. PCC 6303]|uniref:response regulator n=1 Tax=Calothrix sp. PCC 6303 TaxID=1170562 RepID=UPI0002A002EB|nr:response regulator [Calothrix sp. PCC 6303]AFZ03796.1 response regulator receiver protein [Calothrix sp. PCC 6303]